MTETLTPEEKAVKLLGEAGYTVSTAESCTGGLLAGTLINVPGASKVINAGFITYSNEAKMAHLGVLEDTLEKYGAVKGGAMAAWRILRCNPLSSGGYDPVP